MDKTSASSWFSPSSSSNAVVMMNTQAIESLQRQVRSLEDQNHRLQDQVDINKKLAMGPEVKDREGFD